MTTVLLVDDHPVVREGLRGMIDAEDDLTVVGEAGSGAEAIGLAHTLRPDVILMDLRMPGMDGITAIREMRRRGDAKATLPVIVVTADAGSTIEADCMAAGADGVLLKPVSMTALCDASGHILSNRSGGDILWA